MVGGGGGPAASIFVTGLSETDTVTATNGSKTLTGTWTQKPNPAAHGLPDGYTQLEYIESTGTQWINTGISPNTGTGLKISFETSQITDAQTPVGSRSEGSVGYFGCAYENSNFYVYWGSGTHLSSVSANTQYLYKLNYYNDKKWSLNDAVSGSLSQSASITSNAVSLFKFNAPDGGQQYFIGKIYSVVFTQGESVSAEFIPCKNVSGVIGMYDIVGGVFYPNAGTGEFVAGPEVPQAIDCFLIKPIRELGTWTVTATDGAQTATQDVLVDVSTDYEIEMSLSTAWLYRNGDEYEDITGGWTSSGYTNNSVTMQGGEKRSNSLYFVNTGTDNYVGFGTDNTVNLNSVNFIKVEVVSGSFGGYDALLLTKSKTNYAVSANEVKELRLTDTGTFALDVSEITTSVYIMLRCGAGTTLEIGKVWLEK